MGNIQFEDSQFQSNKFSQPQEEKGMIGFLIKKGIANNVKTANIILLTFAIVCFALTFWTFPINKAVPVPIVEGPIPGDEEF